MTHLPHDPPGPLHNAGEIHARGFYIGNNPLSDSGLERLRAALVEALA